MGPLASMGGKGGVEYARRLTARVEEGDYAVWITSARRGGSNLPRTPPPPPPPAETEIPAGKAARISRTLIALGQEKLSNLI